ncbi:hypothetical protein C6A87_015515 [Mycobacterium sp. ITM-2016-00317]|uniref:hypothetical protein n=1 Tax=Mycobacterium sp. ITM-2016-00317 TaxID=2099694 RepID=UPI00287F491F|nr:hypothetical protein [Mycobacterium sp. ITM-2016-00317]WNG85372.1 hypothetical protein C6A87_015515 [Mycobacterium sp. ITM-2016-00317]
MTAEPSLHYEIAERPGLVEVRGVSRAQVAEALDLLAKVHAVQAERADAVRGDLLNTLMLSHVPLTPPSSVAQARRLATHRDALLATPVLTYETLKELRGDARESSTRTWVSRRRDAGDVFTVNHNGRTLIPAFQLDEQGEPRPELQRVLRALISGGVQGWALWTWLTSATSLLSGEVPERLARTAPHRVLRAAERFTAAPAA